jgi:hypothetical protein
MEGRLRRLTGSLRAGSIQHQQVRLAKRALEIRDRRACVVLEAEAEISLEVQLLTAEEGALSSSLNSPPQLTDAAEDRASCRGPSIR